MAPAFVLAGAGVRAAARGIGRVGAKAWTRIRPFVEKSQVTYAFGRPTNYPQLARQLGQAGEEAIGITGPKVGIRIPGTNTMRFPDQVNRATGVLREVKNVQYQAFTRQLRDYNLWCQQELYTFELYVRPSTQLSGPLQTEIDSEIIKLFYIPGAK